MVYTQQSRRHHVAQRIKECSRTKLYEYKMTKDILSIVIY